MKIDKNNIVGSVLQVRATGVDISKDINLPDGKSIAELINDQENTKKNTIKNKYKKNG